MSIRLFTPFGMILGMCLLLSCRGENEQTEEPQAPIQASASVKTSAPAENTVTNATADVDFVVFDGMNFRNKPAEIAEAGLVPIEIIYSKQLFGRRNRELHAENSMVLPDRELVSVFAREVTRRGNRFAVIDIEHWPMGRSDEQAPRSLENYLAILNWFQEDAPGVMWGVYGQIPATGGSEQMVTLARQSDAIFPVLYARDTNRRGWVRASEMRIAMARRWNPNAPVFVFLWPLYHDGTDKPIEPEFWRLQLETARAHADGAIIWMPARYR